MATIDEILGSIIKFSEKEYFTLNDELLAQRESDLLDIDFEGIALNGPKQINCNKYDTLPVVMALRYSGERDWSVDLKKNCFIIVTNLFNGEVIIDRALTSEKDEYYSDDNVSIDSNEDPPQGLALIAAQLAMINVREKISLTWAAGKYAVTLLYFDWVSNSIAIDFIGDDLMTPVHTPLIDPEPNEYDIKKLPSYIQLSQTPNDPKSALTFILETNKTDNKFVLNLFASFTIRVRSYNIPETPISFEFKSGQKETVAAVIPLTLLLLKKDNRSPLKVDLVVPIFGNPVAENEDVHGQCAIDVFSTAGIHELVPGEYVCFLVMDGIAFGPRKINFQS